MMKKLFALLLALAMLLSVSAVFAETPVELTSPEPTAAPVPDTLLATLNGREIRENDEMLQYYYTNLMNQVTDPNGETDQAIARMLAMRYLMQALIVNSKASEVYTETDYEAFRAQAQQEWNDVLNSFMADLGITETSTEEEKAAARADTLSYLETEVGYTEEKYIEESIDAIVYNSYIEKMKADLFAAYPDLAATEEEIQQHYKDLTAEEQEIVGNEVPSYELYKNYGYSFHYIPEGYRGIIHILLKVDEDLLNKYQDLANRLEESKSPEEPVEATAAPEGETPAATEAPAVTEEPVTEEMVEAARQEILDSQKAVIDEILAKFAAGTPFEDLVAEYGTDPGMQSPDNLKNGYPVHAESVIYDPVFTQAAASLGKVGDISDPVVSSFGIHILYYLRDLPAGPEELDEETRAQLKAEIENERVNLALSELLDQWQSEADLVWTAEGEAWQYDAAMLDAYVAAMQGADEAE